MGKVLIVKKTTNEQEVRRCKNCGMDISNKKKTAQFCCRTCWQSYTSGGKFQVKYYN